MTVARHAWDDSSKPQLGKTPADLEAPTLDGTPLADWLGWYFLVSARRVAPLP